MTNFHAMFIVIMVWLVIILHGTGALPTAIDSAAEYFYSQNMAIEQMEKD